MNDLFGYPYKYIIDTSSLIFLKLNYPKEIFNPVWSKLSELFESRILVSCEDVFEELKVKDDQLLDWISQYDYIFLPLSYDIQVNAKNILSTHANILDIKKRKSSADPFVIASAQYYNCSVVTQEKHSGGPNKSKIPDVCDYYNIECINLLDLLSRENFSI